MSQIIAPFTAQQCEKLNQWQQRNDVHPFTCPNRGDGKHTDGGGILIAGPRGWVCPYCDYEQTWAHGFMAQ